MPVPSRSDIEIAQRACVMVGIPKIDTFEDASSEVAIALNDIYEDLVEDCLTIHPWRFASFTVALGPQLAIPPSVNYRAAYALPNDPAPLQIRTVYVSGSIASSYRLYNEQLWLDATPTDSVELEALWRANEAQWPPWFRLYVVLRVAGFLSASITRTGDIAAVMLKEAEAQLARSRSRDSMQQTTQKLRYTKIRSARLGGRPM